MRAQQHEGYIQAGRFAVCARCGWLGPDRNTIAEAYVDLSDHIKPTGVVFPIDVENLRVDEKGHIATIDPGKPAHYIERRGESI